MHSGENYKGMRKIEERERTARVLRSGALLNILVPFVNVCLITSGIKARFKKISPQKCDLEKKSLSKGRGI